MALQQITANDIASLPSGSVSNTQFATGAVENYMSAQGSSFGFRNRIINGAMVIDQRNAGAAQTGVTNTLKYVADRWYWQTDAGITCTIQQVTDAPSGFTNSIKSTVTSAGTPGYAFFQQSVEGYNIADIISTNGNITLSFWVKSSIVGTYTANIHTGDYTWCYNGTYTINNANTWEYKSVTIPIVSSYFNATSKTNGSGLNVRMCVSVSSGGTPNTWINISYNGATTATNWGATNGATFQISGFQLEKGSTATAFEYRDYGRELQMCQRYYEKSMPMGISPGTANYDTVAGAWGVGMTSGASVSQVATGNTFKVQKRTTPTVTIYAYDGTSGSISNYDSNGNMGATGCTTNKTTDWGWNGVKRTGGTGFTNGNYYWFDWTANSEL